MNYAITHTTAYKYSEPASLSQNELFLHPRTTPFQRVMQSSLAILPEPQYRQRRTDYFGNTVDVFMIQHPHGELVIKAKSVVQTSVQAIPDQSATAPWEDVAKRLAAHAHQADFDAYPFLFASPCRLTDTTQLGEHGGGEAEHEEKAAHIRYRRQ